MPLPPARLPTPRQAMERRRNEMKARVEELRKEFLEPILQRFPRMLPTAPDSAARLALYSALMWFAIWMLMAMTLAIKIVFPKLLAQWGWMSYGRLSQAASNILVWGVLFTGACGAAFAILPRLFKVKLWSERIGTQTVLLLDTVVLAGTVLVMLGRTQGISGGEWPWPVDFGLVAVMMGVLQILMFTAMRRNEKKLHVSARYLIGAFHVFPIVYAVANFASPYFFGVRQQIIVQFGVAGQVLALTLAGLGVGEFILPRAAGQPTWSHRTAALGFWSLVAIGPWLGLAHGVLGPQQDWTETLGITFAIASLIPVGFVLTSFFGTVRGGSLADPAVKFVLGGAIFWALGTVQTIVASTRHGAAVLGLTLWNDGVRTAMLGAFGFWLVAAMYHLIPRVRARALYSRTVANAHFWLAILGVGGAWLASSVAGVVQGYIQVTGATAKANFATGEGWAQITAAVRPMQIMRMAAGGLILAGVVLLIFNVQRTLSEGADIAPEPAEAVPVAVGGAA